MLNNSYKHQQRKLNYSPVLKQAECKQFPFSNSLAQKKEELSKVPHRRAHSKNEKYDDPIDHENERHNQSFGMSTQQNFLVQNSFDKHLP